MALKKRKRVAAPTKKTGTATARAADAAAEGGADLQSESSSDEGGGGRKVADEEADEDFFETPDEKRIRLAKEYLRSLDGAAPGEVQERLTQDVADQERKTRVSLHSLRLGEPRFLKGHKECPTCICFSEDGRTMFTGGKDCAILRWDVETGSKDVFPGTKNNFDSGGHAEKVFGVTLLEKKNLLVSAGADKLVRLWDWRCAPRTACTGVLHGHMGSVTDVAAEVDGSSHVYSTSLDKSVKIWDVVGKRCQDTLLGHVAGASAVDIYAKGRPVTVGADKTVRMWKVDKDTHLMFNKHTYAVDAVVAVDHERAISGSQDGGLHLWTSGSKKPLASATVGANKWVSALGAVKGSDVAFSGNTSGELQTWRSVASQPSSEGKKAGVTLAEAAPVIQANGCINAIAVSQRFVACAVGKEHKYGGWFFNQKSRNGILLVPLSHESTTV